MLAHRGEFFGEHAHVSRPSVGQCLDAPRGLFRIMRIGSDGRQADDVERVLYGQSRHVNDFEASRMIPEHSKRAGDISAGQDELITAQ